MVAPKKTKLGRPSIYSDELVAKLCGEIAVGKSMREICRMDDMPAITTVFRWLAEKPSFREQYAHAKEAQAEYLEEEILDIADDGTNDWMERRNEHGEGIEVVPNHEHIQRSRLRVDSRKWLMSKLLPKKYGELLRQEVTGADGGPIVIKGGLPE